MSIESLRLSDLFHSNTLSHAPSCLHKLMLQAWNKAKTEHFVENIEVYCEVSRSYDLVSIIITGFWLKNGRIAMIEKDFWGKLKGEIWSKLSISNTQEKSCGSHRTGQKQSTTQLQAKKILERDLKLNQCWYSYSLRGWVRPRKEGHLSQ